MSLLGKIMAILNVLAAGAFVFLALKDYERRQVNAFAVAQQDVAIHGMPLQEQYTDPHLPPEVYRQKAALPPDAPELKKLFPSGAGQPVNVQVKAVEEVASRQGPNSFVAALDQAARQTAEKAKDNPGPVLKKLLDQLAATGPQRVRNEAILARLGPANHGKLLEQVARRWMLAQALLPLEEVTPGGHRELLAYQIGDLDGPAATADAYFKKLDDNYKKLEDRLLARIQDSIRPTPPYRNNQAGVLLTVQTLPGLMGSPSVPVSVGGKTFKYSDFDVARNILRTSDFPGAGLKFHYLFYQRLPADQKVSVRILDVDTHKDADGNFEPVTLQLTNVKGQPEIELKREGNAYVASQKDVLKEPRQVLSGVITITEPSKKAKVHFFLIEREPLEQRQAIAYAMFTLSTVMTPEGAFLGVPTTARTEGVVGRQAYTFALDLQTQLLNQVALRRRQELAYDLQNFIDRYNRETEDRLPYLIEVIRRTRDSLADWKKQQDMHDKQLQARKAHYDDVVERLKKARQNATDALNELELWQKRLFAAQKAGAGVNEENQRLERQIRRMEKQR